MQSFTIATYASVSPKLAVLECGIFTETNKLNIMVRDVNKNSIVLYKRVEIFKKYKVWKTDVL